MISIALDKYLEHNYILLNAIIHQNDTARESEILTQQSVHIGKKQNQRTTGPENAHLKPDLGVLSHHEMTLTLNTHTPLLTSQVVCICKVSGLRLQ